MQKLRHTHKFEALDCPPDEPALVDTVDTREALTSCRFIIFVRQQLGKYPLISAAAHLAARQSRSAARPSTT